MNADLHTAGGPKTTGKGNLFVTFGRPDIDLISKKDGQAARVGGRHQGLQVVHPRQRVDLPHPGSLLSGLKPTPRAEIDTEAGATLHSDACGRIAVKVISNPGDEVIKAFRVN